MASKVKNNQTDNKSCIPSWAAVSTDCPYQNGSKRMFQEKYKGKTHFFPEKNIVNSVIKLHLWCPFSSIDDWINAHWVPSLNTAHINVLNQLWQSHKSILSLISHEPVVIFYNLVGNVKLIQMIEQVFFKCKNFDGKLFII